MPSFRFEPLPLSVAISVRQTLTDPFGHAVTRKRVDSVPGYPCRRCLQDVGSGNDVLLFSYSPLPQHSLYWTVGPVFICAHDCESAAPIATTPAFFRGRLLALRAYDETHHIVVADVVDGDHADNLIAKLFARGETRYIHAHFARNGCFACRIERVTA